MASGPLIYRQRLLTRLTHWVWAVSLFFLLLTGLQIFNAHPARYWGQVSTSAHPLLALTAVESDESGIAGVTTIAGHAFDTTGILGASTGPDGLMEERGFPSWLTLPSYRDLATGRRWPWWTRSRGPAPGGRGPGSARTCGCRRISGCTVGRT